MIDQLNTQTIFEKMLKSKASKNEDRFYAVLPQSKYKDEVNQVDHWKINTLFWVKLKLFEIMDTKDRWNLLFLSGHHRASNTYEILPSFCASNICWDYVDKFVSEYPTNFAKNISSPITLSRTKTSKMYYLQLAPLEYYVKQCFYIENDLLYASRQKKTLYENLQLDEHCLIDFVCLPQYDLNAIPFDTRKKYKEYNNIVLIGSFLENKWTLYNLDWTYQISKWKRFYNDDTVFNIY
ncbi:unnamed protein product [Absidia cylindrospora]